VVTLALALGACRMSARNALIRRLPAVETLGSVTVLGTDKTGTLTQGNMVVRRLWTPDGGEAEIDGAGYGPDGELTRSGRPLDPGQAPDLGRLLTAGALCNDAALRPPEGDQEAWTAVGDPTEAALLAAAARSGLDPGELRDRFPRVAEVPFDSDRKRMTTAQRLPDGRVRVICKGAPEVVLKPEFITGDDRMLKRAAARAGELARGGFRVLAVAEADRPGLPDAASMERGLRLLGLTAILDPPRPAAAATIASCQATGITPVLITGDHPATARAIARDLGIIGEDAEVVDCGEDGTPRASARRGCSPAPPPSRSSPSSRRARRSAT
jgi:Ca2+-transporting ATPase